MISAYFDPDLKAIKNHGWPIERAEPRCQGILHLPRFHPPLDEWSWTGRNLIHFIIDSGSDSTVLDLRASVNALPNLAAFDSLDEYVEAKLYGGKTATFGLEPANLLLIEDDGSQTRVETVIGLSVPPREMIEAGYVADELLRDKDNILGRDVLQYFSFQLIYTDSSPPAVLMARTRFG